MKTLLTSTLGAWALLVSPGCAIAQDLVIPAVPITVEAHVHDPEGTPVENATVYLTLPRYRLGDKNQESIAKTDKGGLATVSGIAQQDYILSAEKPGYYRTQGPHRGINDEKSFQQYAVGVQKIELELRPIRNPIVGLSRDVDRRPLPKIDGPMGFDLEVGDWVAPFGEGRTPDFIFELDGRFTSSTDYDQKFTLRFSRPQDGITAFKHPKNIGSALKWPYEAPLSGYESSRTWILKWSLKEGGRGDDHRSRWRNQLPLPRAQRSGRKGQRHPRNVWGRKWRFYPGGRQQRDRSERELHVCAEPGLDAQPRV